jgi:catalase
MSTYVHLPSFSRSYTDDAGVQNNTPVFFLRDPAKFPHFIHTQKRDPQTNLKDANAFWDYLSQNPEAFHQVQILFSDRGIPDGYRKMVSRDFLFRAPPVLTCLATARIRWTHPQAHQRPGRVRVCPSTSPLSLPSFPSDLPPPQFHYRCDQGTAFLTQEKADKLAGTNPDYAQQDLFESIEKGDFPSWTLSVQTMTVEQAEAFKYNILDLTKVWSHHDVSPNLLLSSRSRIDKRRSQYPLRPIGKLTLNQNPQNYFRTSLPSPLLLPLTPFIFQRKSSKSPSPPPT